MSSIYRFQMSGKFSNSFPRKVFLMGVLITCEILTFCSNLPTPLSLSEVFHGCAIVRIVQREVRSASRDERFADGDIGKNFIKL